MAQLASIDGQLVDKDTGEVVGSGSIEMMTEEAVGGTPIGGTEEQLSFDLGSEFALSDSTLKLTAVPVMTVEGQFQEGDRIKIVLEVEVEHLAFPPIKSRGFRVGTERRHIAQVLSAQPL